MKTRDENGRKRLGNDPNHFCFHILIRKWERERKISIGKTKSVMRDIGNGTIRSEACRLWSETGTQNGNNKSIPSHANELVQQVKSI